TGLKFRLPSESEWEYAARAGATTEYPWENSLGAAQVNGESDVNKTSTAGSYPANRFGIFDMIDNVREWTADCFSSTYAGAPNDGSARTICDTAYYVIRGGGWHGESSGWRHISDRDGGEADTYIGLLGFRLAQDF